MSVQKKELGGKIKSARESANDGRGMSQAELAQLIGIKQASLSEIEVGKSTPRKPTLIALSFVLNDDFGEEWLREFFKSAVNKGVKEFNHAALAELLSEADELDEQAIKEMRHIWDMVGSEIERRKN
jgi:transcriptional regulator with XRE-family HTH domain